MSDSKVTVRLQPRGISPKHVAYRHSLPRSYNGPSISLMSYARLYCVMEALGSIACHGDTSGGNVVREIWRNGQMTFVCYAGATGLAPRLQSGFMPLLSVHPSILRSSLQYARLGDCTLRHFHCRELATKRWEDNCAWLARRPSQSVVLKGRGSEPVSSQYFVVFKCSQDRVTCCSNKACS